MAGRPIGIADEDSATAEGQIVARTNNDLTNGDELCPTNNSKAGANVITCNGGKLPHQQNDIELTIIDECTHTNKGSATQMIIGGSDITSSVLLQLQKQVHLSISSK